MLMTFNLMIVNRIIMLVTFFHDVDCFFGVRNRTQTTQISHQLLNVVTDISLQHPSTTLMQP